MKSSKEFKVVAKSSNTNSFGLYQMIVIAKDGEAYKTCASMYNAKEQGESVHQTVISDDKTGEIKERYFLGHELTEKSPEAPKEVIDEVWK